MFVSREFRFGGRDGHWLLPVLLAIAASLVCHVCALLRFVAAFPSLGLPEQYPWQFRLLLLSSFALSVLACLSRPLRLRPIAKALAFAFQSLIFVLISLAIGKHLLTSFFLLAALLVETSLLFPFPRTVWISSTILVVSVLSQKPVSAWAIERTWPALFDSATSILFSLLFALLMNCLAYTMRKLSETGKLTEVANHAIASLMDANIGFQRHATLVEEQSARDERNRITREIHDTIGYALTNVMMMMEAASDLSVRHRKELRALLEQARQEAQTALTDTRRSLHELRAFDSKSDLHGLASLNKLTRAFEAATGIRVDVEYTNVSSRLENERAVALYRMVQEAMTNSLRHGKATRIWVHFWQNDSMIHLRVRDDGRAGPVAKEGIGLSGMRERVEVLGGRFQYLSSVNGFVVQACIPAPKGVMTK